MLGPTVERAPMSDELARIMAIEWQSTLDAISDGLAVLDPEGRIQRFNAGLALLLARSESELAGMTSEGLWAGLPLERQPFRRAIESRRREGIELEYDGRLLSITVDPMFDPHGQVIGAVEIVRDMTVKRRLERKPEVRDHRHAGWRWGARFQ